MKNIFKTITLLLIINSFFLTYLNAQSNIVITGSNVVLENNFLVLQNTNFDNSSTFHSGSGTVIFSGDASSLQSQLSGTSQTTFYNLTINKTTNNVILNNSLIIENQLNLTNGNIDISNSDLTIQNTGNITGGSANSFIKTSNTGTLIQEVSSSNVLFPIGNQSYTPIILNNSGTTDDFKARVENVVYQDGTSGNAITTDVVNATWFIDEATTGGSDITATFQWNASDELTNFDRTDAFVSTYHTSMWNNGTASVVSGSNPYTLTENGISTFAPFIVASDAAVLPVELLYFYGKKDGENVLLSWETATEMNNDYFDVEFSLDGITFAPNSNLVSWTKIGEVQGAGTTTENQSYEFLHNSSRDVALQRLYRYYRLKQVDNDGKYEYSNIVMIEFDAINIPNINVFPNPTTDFINIEINENQIGETAQVIDIQGRIIKEFQLQETNKQYSVTSLAAGTYFIKIGIEVQKIIIEK